VPPDPTLASKLLALAAAYRKRDERVVFPGPRPLECIGICHALRPEGVFGFDDTERRAVVEALKPLPPFYPGIDYKWAYDDFDSRAAWLEAFAAGGNP
jgi:hypothetical protein